MRPKYETVNTMIIRIIVYSWLLFTAMTQGPMKNSSCLTGYMTDVQSWVDKEGRLIASGTDFTFAIDLTAISSPLLMLQQQMKIFRSNNHYVKYLSMAKCKLVRVPMMFQLEDTSARRLSETVEYVTLYGNRFSQTATTDGVYSSSMNATTATQVGLGGISFNQLGLQARSSDWSAGFEGVNFPRLKELDLRACSIRVLNGYTFSGMKSLEALYLGENEIHYISTEAFSGLESLVHLDISRNSIFDRSLTLESKDLLVELKNLMSLDLSFTRLSPDIVDVLKGLGKKFQRLSLCDTSLNNLEDGLFKKTSLKYLDLSGNLAILSLPNVLRGTENTLKVLYAERVGLQNMDLFSKFKHLEVLKLTHNRIAIVPPKITKTLTSLKILDLDFNRITTWLEPWFSEIPNLNLLSMRNNNINLISENMITDFENITYVGLSGNYLVCNCHSREFYEVALQNEKKMGYKLIKEDKFQRQLHKAANFHKAFEEFNNQIKDRRNVSKICEVNSFYCSNATAGLELKGNFLLFDYDEELYRCLVASESEAVPISHIPLCNHTQRDIGYEVIIQQSKIKLILAITIPCVVLPLLLFCYVFRRNFRYFLITIRNSAMLSLINKSEVSNDSTIFHYDVFVSYCNDDRVWVLEELLPHVEKGCNVSVCLHERDFQVGLSILENIVSCMDRSKSIMLVISQKFLLSQWCQFEMHLAQHRLLETRREDLILILLEEIPRRLRPNTLHYLMLTKTYIVWPKVKAEEAVFWKRLKKSLITTTKQKQGENISLA